MLGRLIYLYPVSGSNKCWDDFSLAKLMRNRIQITFGHNGTCLFNSYLRSLKKLPAFLVRKYSGPPAEVRFAKHLDCGFPNCLYGVSLQMSKGAIGACRGTLVISTRMGSHVSDITPHSEEWKTALMLLVEVESFGEMQHFLAQLFRSMLGIRYELLPEQHWRLDGYLMHPIHHSRIPIPSGTALTTIWETYEPPCFHKDTWTDFQSCTVNAFQNLRRGLCCLPVADNFIAGHANCLVLHVASPGLEPQRSHRPWDPLPLVHGEVFTRPCTGRASKPASRCWVCPAAGQEKPGSGRRLSDEPLGCMSQILLQLYATQELPVQPAHISSAQPRTTPDSQDMEKRGSLPP